MILAGLISDSVPHAGLCSSAVGTDLDQLSSDVFTAARRSSGRPAS